MKLFLLVIKSLRRNSLRTALTSLAIVVLVLVVVMVWTVLDFLTNLHRQREFVKAIVTNRWLIPSQLLLAYEQELARGAPRGEPGDVEPLDTMTWQFFGGTIESNPAKRTKQNMMFAIALDPHKLVTMVEELEDLDPELARKLKELEKGGRTILDIPEAELSEHGKLVRRLADKKHSIIIGVERLKELDKKVGQTITVYSFNYRGVALEFDIVGSLPSGRYSISAFFRKDYLNDALEARDKTQPVNPLRLNLFWLKVRDQQEFLRIVDQIENSPNFPNPAVKCEAMSSAIATFLDAYRDLLWCLQWLLVPFVLASITLIVGNAIAISVRERRTEVAVLKVLGFRPWQVLTMVLGESLLLGLVSGFLSAFLTYGIVNLVFGGVKIPIAFFPAFLIPVHALWWGPATGAATALLGSFLPAWNACRVNVAEVFARVG